MKFFTRDEFKCRCGACQNDISDEFIAFMDEVREEFGAPLIVNSGFRCPDYDTKVGGKGPHTTGLAGDFRVGTAMDRHRLVKTALAFGAHGVGVADSFVHIDRIQPGHKRWPRPALWTYPRRG